MFHSTTGMYQLPLLEDNEIYKVVFTIVCL
jgi:hypothetical protein